VPFDLQLVRRNEGWNEAGHKELAGNPCAHTRSGTPETPMPTVRPSRG